MSDADVVTGARWSAEIAGELSSARAGVICVTAENLTSPWLLFEAGALSKTLDKTYVSPYLLDLQPADVTGPLSQFQLARADKEGTRRLLGSINSQLDKGRISDPQLDDTFEVWWPRLEAKLTAIPEVQVLSPRSDRAIIEELLDLVRNMSRPPAEAAEPLTMEILDRELEEIAEDVEAVRRMADMIAAGKLDSAWMSTYLKRSETRTSARLKNHKAKLSAFSSL